MSSSYVDGAVRLADHRGLLTGGLDLAAGRAELADELHTLVRRARDAQARAAARFLELMRLALTAPTRAQEAPWASPSPTTTSS